ncbi:hypothetical protein N7457_009747 [Penicillium paradoxum]|uniref:uncharacterized protein n=1 Tax=Penicillium paradoxum TaxID=176176 RepID=UPI002546CA6F|nr:uncharacterized protein N7457_009747 [Penicillium paradoxum]KAJ5774851.1 hypothetical protein N7457_009747 [Penicillium paradoxum]
MYIVPAPFRQEYDPTIANTPPEQPATLGTAPVSPKLPDQQSGYQRPDSPVVKFVWTESW